MNDYRELIADLRNPNKVFYETFLNEESKSVESVVAYKAANAIERLVNDYEILAKMYAKVSEDLCVRTKERDAAVADLYELFTKDESPCAFCVAEHCDKCIINYPYWEWRGVQKEDNDEID